MDMQGDISTQNREDNFFKVLREKKIVSKSMLLTLQKEADYFQQTIFQYVMQHHCIEPILIQEACANCFHFPVIDLHCQNVNTLSIENSLLKHIKSQLVLPIAQHNNQLMVVICNPNDIDTAKNIAFHRNAQIFIYFAPYDVLCRLHNASLNQLYYAKLTSHDETTVQMMAQHLLSDAIHRNASDIHIEPYQKTARVRFRLDGLLHEIIQLTANIIDPLVSCLKVMAQLDIAIKRMPQDGRLTFRSYLGFIKDCRISTCPTHCGEKVVIRLLDINSRLRSIDELGLQDADKHFILRIMQQPQGLILVTGPTGSGKTITLYTLLGLLNQAHRNIATIEDPIEIQMGGVNQTHVNTKTGLTFLNALRTLLRQDPDVIMVGEIRDHETAELAIRAAQTGHLVLSTLHTNSAPEAIMRLQHLGIAPVLLTSALTLIIAQRLVRKLCVHCKFPEKISSQLFFDAGFLEPYCDNITYNAKGCSHCTQGYAGRLGVFEILPMHTTIKELILNHASHITITQQNKVEKHDDLWRSGLRTVMQGITSLDELYRVIPRNMYELTPTSGTREDG